MKKNNNNKKKTNPALRRSIILLEREGRKKKSGIWSDSAEKLSRGSATKVEVNLGHVSRTSEDASAVFIPGKVLASGSIEKKLVVGAFSFSSSAIRKIAAAGGEAVTVEEFIKRYPKGSGVLLVE